MLVNVKALEVVVDVAHAVCESNAETLQDIVSDRSELLWFIGYRHVGKSPCKFFLDHSSNIPLCESCRQLPMLVKWKIERSGY